jgi:hypothetical protein
MQTSARWSNRSDACRIELGPSRQYAACLAALGVLGGAGWWASDASALVVAAGSLAWLAAGLRLAHRELRRPVESLVLRPDGAAELGGCPVDGAGVDWRGPFFVLSWQAGGRAVRRIVFPDVLDAAARRELRLWRGGARERGSTAAVAP